MVFYDLTTIRIEGLSEQPGDVRQRGMSKQGLIARQFMLGVVQTACGMPIHHEVFAGNTAEAPTLEPTLHKVLSRYPHIKRLIVVADRGAKARFFHEVADARLSRIIKVDFASDLFSYAIDTQAQQQAELMDGKLLLVTNVRDLTAQQIVSRYKALADIERGFKVLKSELEIVPVFHRLPERIRAHASICFLALIVYRVMRQRLKLTNSTLSPEAALDQLRRIQRHSVRIDAAAPIAGVSCAGMSCCLPPFSCNRTQLRRPCT